MTAAARIAPPPRAPRRAARACAVAVGSALAGALALQAVALAAGGRDLRAGTTGATVAGMLVSAFAAGALARRWAELRWPGTIALVVIACAAAFGVASAMITIGWLAGFYYPGWTRSASTSFGQRRAVPLKPFLAPEGLRSP